MLTMTYIALAGIGVVYVVGSLLLGHLADAFGHGVDAGGGTHGVSDHYGVNSSGHGTATAGDGGAATFHFPLFSPLALATLAGAVGGLGLMTRHGLHFGERLSLLVSLPLGFVLTYAVMYVTWRALKLASGASALNLQDLVGAPAEILTPIPAGGVGEAAASARGQRFPAPAREVEGRPVGRGTPVTVVRVSGGTLIVAADERR